MTTAKVTRIPTYDAALTSLINEAREEPELTLKRARELIDNRLEGDRVRDFLAYQLVSWGHAESES